MSRLFGQGCREERRGREKKRREERGRDKRGRVERRKENRRAVKRGEVKRGGERLDAYLSCGPNMGLFWAVMGAGLGCLGLSGEGAVPTGTRQAWHRNKDDTQVTGTRQA